MAFIPYKDIHIHIGDIVKLLEPVRVYNGVFESGTIVEVIDETDDGFRFRIKDECGNTASGVDREKLVVIKNANKESDWIYETGKEVPEILGSGSDYYNVQTVKEEEAAFKLLHNGTNNYLIRFKLRKGLREEQEYWDKNDQKWHKN